MAFQPQKHTQQKPWLPGAPGRLRSPHPGLLGARASSPHWGGNPCLACILCPGEAEGEAPRPCPRGPPCSRGRSFYSRGEGSPVTERCPQPACDFSGQMQQLVWGLGEGLGSGIFRRAIRGFQKAGVWVAGTVGVQGPPSGYILRHVCLPLCKV